MAFTCAIVGVDTVFYSALTPLLPHYAAVAGLSKAGAGVLILILNGADGKPCSARGAGCPAPRYFLTIENPSICTSSR